MSDIKAKIRQFVIDNFLFGNVNGFKDDTSFLEEGILDSTGVLELVTFIEEEFQLKVEDDELVPENLDCISNVATFLDKKLSADAS